MEEYFLVAFEEFFVDWRARVEDSYVYNNQLDALFMR
jgi:hypothetical protein